MENELIHTLCFGMFLSLLKMYVYVKDFSLRVSSAIATTQLLHIATTPLLHTATTPLLHIATTPLLHIATTPLLHIATTPLLHIELSLSPVAGDSPDQTLTLCSFQKWEVTSYGHKNGPRLCDATVLRDASTFEDEENNYTIISQRGGRNED